MRLTFYWITVAGNLLAMVMATSLAQHGHGQGDAHMLVGSGRTSWRLGDESIQASIQDVRKGEVVLTLEDGSGKTVKRDQLQESERVRVKAWVERNRPPKGFGKPDRVVRLKTLQGQMRYDQEEITVLPGAKVQLVLQNVDDMHHNLILCSEDSASGMEVAQAAWKLGGEGFAKQWVPEHPKVLFASRMADPHSTIHGYFAAPEKEGDYPYVCTLPGHAAFMKGVLKVRERPNDFSELTYVLYHGSFNRLPDFDRLVPVATDHVASGLIDLSVSSKRKNQFAVVFQGDLNVPENGDYEFVLASDDGSRLEVGGQVVIDNDGVHGTRKMEARRRLTKGRHPIRVSYFEQGGEEVLYLGWSGPGFEHKPLCAWPPSGQERHAPTGIPIAPRDGEARLYRNFIEGAGNRAIGVGYPGGINVAFDADQMRLALVWLGAFMDGARHWTGRGQGHQPPAGYGVIQGPPGAPLARLRSESEPWPKAERRASGYQFKGYRLVGVQRLPVFSYRYGEKVTVTDAITPHGEVLQNNVSLHRRLTLSGGEDDLFFRAARARDIKPLEDGGYLIDASLIVSLKSKEEPVLRQSEGEWELLVPVVFEGGKAEIEQTISYLLGEH